MIKVVYANAEAGLNFRTEPNGHVIKTLPIGSRLGVIDMDGDWLHVTFGYEPGWVHRDYVSETDPVGTGNTLVARLCAEYGIAENVVRAVIAVESGGACVLKGRVVIRFEPHVFASRHSNAQEVRRYYGWDQMETWKNHTFHGKIFHGDQDLEYRALDFAAKLGGDAAYQSISMGAPQIMGFHFTSLGYVSAEAMLAAFIDPDVQIEAMFKFLKFSNALDPLRRGDYVAFARIYNGPGQAQTYAKLIQERL